MLFLLKKLLNYLKDNIFDCLQHIMIESSNLEEDIIVDVRNLLRLKKELNYTAIKDIIKLKNKTLLVESYLYKIRPYLKDINNLKKSDMWIDQLTIANNFISSIDKNDEEHLMHSKSDNIEIMINDEADEVIKKLFDSLKNRYQNNLESMKDSVFNYVRLL